MNPTVWEEGSGLGEELPPRGSGPSTRGNKTAVSVPVVLPCDDRKSRQTLPPVLEQGGQATPPATTGARSGPSASAEGVVLVGVEVGAPALDHLVGVAERAD